MTLTLDNGQVLELMQISTPRFSVEEEHEPKIPDLYGLTYTENYGHLPLPRIAQITYPSIRIGNQYYAYKLKQ